ncbi:MAG: MotA/TolQ/ExbB proton channel family protein [Saprospiraceae bacterium]|nr:MotA/TolQ/ExbB proton channel family protein [Saprospiraceae bacterium]
MKKIIALLSLFGLLLLVGNQTTYAQDEAPATEQTDAKPAGLTKVLKQKFIEGDPKWMFPVLLCLILGLAIAIERIISLNLATSNKTKLLQDVDAALQAGNVEEAVEIAKSTKGPVAGILFQGLDRVSEGLDVVEKSISSYGSVLAGRLEKGLSWLSLFIAIAPMLGFMGTVIGMIGAFDNIAKAGDVDIKVISADIKVALLTTVFGLITAIILQIFYNYILSKIDGLVNDMEDASVSLVDMLVKYRLEK